MYNFSDAQYMPYTKHEPDSDLHYSETYGEGYGFGFFYPEGSKLTDTVPEDFRWIVSPHWDQFPPVNPLYMYAAAFAYIFLWILSFFGNGTVMYLFLKTRSLRSPSNMLIVNLAFADFIMMCSQCPQFIYIVFGTGYWTLGAVHCEVYGWFGSVSGMTAIYTMVMIGYDRYNVIVKGMKGVRITSGIVMGMLAFIYAWVLTWNFLPLFRVWGAFTPEGLLASCGIDYLTKTVSVRSYATSLFFVAYVTPLILLIFFYSQIVKSVWDHEDSMREQAKKMNVESLRSEENKKMSAECRVAKVAMTNVLLWVSIWTPYAVVVLTGVWGNQDSITPLVSQIPALIAKTASCLNPLVYAISHPKYRQALQEAMPWLCVHEPADDTKSITTESASTGEEK